MKSETELKEIVKNKYSEIALQDKEYNSSSCCGATESCSEVYNIMSEDYSALEGYNQEADLGLGCGLPTQFAEIKKGDTVIDLGSGAGNDCFVARAETGETGKVIGIDFTPAMIEKARQNAESRGVVNVEFRQGDIETMPVSDDSADVVVSNCVLNLVPNKNAVFAEIFRVLKPGGHFSISDIVLEGELPQEVYTVAEMYAGCVSGAVARDEYLEGINNAGFQHVRIQKDKEINVPEDVLRAHLSDEGVEEYKKSKGVIRSITVYGVKPTDDGKRVKEDKASCTPGSCCC
ncbi:MAG: arsenite methyltransferase [Pyrinomonadaceae bacterium]